MQILSDESKRANYDQFGHSAFTGEGPTGAGGFGAGGFGGFNGFGGGNPFGGGGFGSSPQDIFEQLFRGGMGGMGGAGGMGFDAVGRNIKANLTIPFMEAAKGTTRTIAFEAISKCKPCKGGGVKPGRQPHRCNVCGGSGQVWISTITS